MNLLKSLKAIVSGKCAYWRLCNLYDERSKTCNDPAEAEGYCGKYAELENKEGQEVINKAYKEKLEDEEEKFMSGLKK